jgi:uncharacterized membrane protein
MIKYILLSLTSLLLVSCTQVNTTGEKTITKGDETIAEVGISLSKMDALNSLAEMDEPQSHPLLFKASGIEPGWFAEVYENKLRLVVDYGKDSLILEDKFEGLDNSKGYVFDNHLNKVSIHIENKPCIADGNGNKMDRTVVITYKAKSYKGCGSFIK